jgi:tRNA (cmo5U34)-methyltransferase
LLNFKLSNVSKQDDIFSEGNLSGLPFSFNDEVTEVFEDMIDRSVPGYKTSLNLVNYYSKKYSQESTNFYDLGCSLGASTKVLLGSSNNRNIKIISIDNSPAMIERCKKSFKSYVDKGRLELKLEDINTSEIINASVVVINFVLQFLDLENRELLIDKIYKGLKPEGILIISEKIHYESSRESESMSLLHHGFKEKNGYTKMEISAKRDSLEGVLVTETEQVHLKRMKRIGFKISDKLMSNLNFATYLFIK